MASGDHLVRKIIGDIWHHGIDIGDGTVIDFANANGTGSLGRIAQNQIRRVPFDTFADGQKVFVVWYQAGECFPADVVVERAKSRLGETGYDLFNNNCEHFATWCKTGVARSLQVEEFKKRTEYVAPQVAAVAATAATSSATGTAVSVLAGGVATVLLGPIGAVAGAVGIFLSLRRRRKR